jgi:hypothetical protein
MLTVTMTPDESARSPNSSCYWIASTTLDDGRRFSARSKHGASNELARTLVSAGVPDQPMQTYEGKMKGIYYPSFHEAAKWTYEEGNRPLHRVRWRPRPEIE